jgi:hypothetical protein
VLGTAIDVCSVGCTDGRADEYRPASEEDETEDVDHYAARIQDERTHGSQVPIGGSARLN